jgi:hypothetical protein
MLDSARSGRAVTISGSAPTGGDCELQLPLSASSTRPNSYIGYPVELVAALKPCSWVEIARILNSHLRVDFEMKLDTILKASVTRVNLLNAFDAGGAQGHSPPAVQKFLDPFYSHFVY